MVTSSKTFAKKYALKRGGTLIKYELNSPIYKFNVTGELNKNVRDHHIKETETESYILRIYRVDFNYSYYNTSTKGSIIELHNSCFLILLMFLVQTTIMPI